MKCTHSKYTVNIIEIRAKIQYQISKDLNIRNTGANLYLIVENLTVASSIAGD